MHFHQGSGCTYCSHTGYRGRIGVYEYLEVDMELADALRANDSLRFATVARAREDFKPLVLCALDYAKQGITSLDEVIRLAGDVEAYEMEDLYLNGGLPGLQMQEVDA
jgi:MSHA biogenesis protein MshE